MYKKNCHKPATIHNMSLIKAILSKDNSVVRKGSIKFTALRIYCQDTNEFWRLTNLVPLLQIRRSDTKKGKIIYTVPQTLACSMMYQSLPNVTRCIFLLYWHEHGWIQRCMTYGHYNDISLKYLLNKFENQPFFIT